MQTKWQEGGFVYFLGLASLQKNLILAGIIKSQNMLTNIEPELADNMPFATMDGPFLRMVLLHQMLYWQFL